MNHRLLDAFFERDLTAGEEEELATVLAGSVEGCEMFAERMASLCISLGFLEPVSGGAVSTAGGSGAGIGQGAIAALVSGSVVTGGTVAVWLMVKEPVVAPPEVVPAPQVEPAPGKRPVEIVKEEDAPQVSMSDVEARRGDHLVIRVSLAEETMVRVVVLNEKGRFVAEVGSGQFGTGEHRFAWDGRDHKGDRVSAGRYLVEVRHDGNVMKKWVEIAAKKLEERK